MSDLEKTSLPHRVVNTGGWSSAARAGFRFAFIYWALYCLHIGAASLVLWMLPGISRGINWLLEMPAAVALWVGVHLFHLTGVAAAEHPTGSGDTALEYIHSFCLAVFALVGAALWTVVNELRGGRREYRTLYAWLRLVMRFTLGVTLLTYGFDKVFDLQFYPPGLLYLTETYGDSSPMRLLWAFMGSSIPYTIFGGLAEVIPGFLLLFRRTSTLGALVSAGVTLNVVLLNYCYDVPVKLYATHLFLASLFLLLPDAVSLWRIFFLGQTAALSGLHLPRWERLALRRVSHVLQVLILGTMLYQTALGSYREWRRKPSGHAPLYGIWALDKVDGFALKEAWTKVIFDRPAEMLVIHGDGSREVFAANFDEKAQRIEFPELDKPSALRWIKGDGGKLTLAGDWLGKPGTLSLHKLNGTETFPLQTRGFHWVQEYPFNR